MHMADALISTPVGIAGAATAATLIVVAGAKLKKSTESRENLVPLMGVLGSFIFAAQMINFSIPGTGSSGHIIGGVLLSAILGPWAGFLTLASVLIVQCLVFADGGLLALGCNILNMGAMSCLVAYPLIFRPIARYPASTSRILWGSILACIAGLELGAVAVTAETYISGITALPFAPFLGLMSSIHLAIGLGEGLATGAVLCYVAKSRPDLLSQSHIENASGKSIRKPMIIFAVAAAALAGGLAFFASTDPDGLEWSVEKLTGKTELVANSVTAVSQAAGSAQQATAIMPDYDGTFAGIIGAVIVMALVWVISSILLHNRKHAVARKSTEHGE